MKARTVSFCLLMSAFLCGNNLNLETESKDTVRVLFVGNSYTYYNSLPQMVKAMAEQEFPEKQIETGFVGGGGATLQHHWDTGLALEEIETAKWDYVVLQEQSMLGSAVTAGGEQYFSSPDLFYTYARKFDAAIKKNGAETVLFMTWARKEYKHQQKYLSYAYMAIAEELNSRIAPVGMVWDSLSENKNINLYQKDGSHPSVHGSYLSAATLFSVIFDTRPSGLPGRVEGYEILKGGELSKEKRLLCDLPETEAEIIQKAAADILDQMESNNGYLPVEKAISDRKPPPLSYITNLFRTAEGQLIILIAIAFLFLIMKGVNRLLVR